MFKSIKWRLATIYVILVILVMIMAGSYIVSETYKDQYEKIEKDIVDKATFISTNLDDMGTSEEMGQVLKDITGQGSYLLKQTLYLLDREGKVIYPSDLTTPVSFTKPQVMCALYGIKPDKLDEIQIDKENYLGYAEAVSREGVVEYVIYVLANTETLEETKANAIKIIIVAMLMAIMIAGVLGVIFSNFLTKPISVLTQKAREMAAGNLDLEIGQVSDDEIGDLTQNFNTMAASLKDTLDQISGEKNKLEIVFSYMTDGIIVFDRSGTITNFNQASADMLKITVQKTYVDVFSEYTAEKFKCPLRTCN